MMTRLVFIRKASNTIGARFNVGNESRYSSAKMMKSMKMVIKMGKSSEPNTRTRRDISSNIIM